MKPCCLRLSVRRLLYVDIASWPWYAQRRSRLDLHEASIFDAIRVTASPSRTSI